MFWVGFVVLIGYIEALEGEPICDSTCSYLRAREALVLAEEEVGFDHGVRLGAREKEASLRAREIERFDSEAEFITAYNFRAVKTEIESTPTFGLIRGMPKGGLLHTHAFGDAWKLLKMASYDPECYIHVSPTGEPLFTFMFSPTVPNHTEWKNVQKWRSEFKDYDWFDTEVLYPLIQYYTPPKNVSQDAMWEYFDETIFRASSLASKESIWIDWIWDGLTALSADGVIHIELRGFMNFIFVPGTTTLKYTDTEMVGVWKNLLDRFNESVPPLRRISIRFINAVPRNWPVEAIKNSLLETVEMQLNNATHGLVVGFDIVDEEDKYNSLLYYLDAWLFIKSYLEERGLPPMNYYFHAAETNWFKDKRSNLFDALLLNTTRIGHGFALHNYPTLQEQVKERKIAIEVCPISNQLLRVVQDLREHPAREMMSNSVPVTISSDDSVIYGYSGLTYDYWMAYTGWNLTLAGMKTLTRNSIEYSALPDSLKQHKLAQLDGLWKAWIQNVVKTYLSY